MWDQLTVTSNRECARATESRAKVNMRVSRSHRCAGRKFCLLVASQSLFLVELFNSNTGFQFLRPLFMPRNIAHRAQRELERTVKRLRAFCATEHRYTTVESLWAGVEKNKSGAVLFFNSACLLRLNRKTQHSLLRL